MTMWARILAILSSLRILDFLDIAIVAYAFYKLIILIRRTRAVQLLKGLIVLLLAALVSDRLELVATSWLLQRTLTVGLIAIPIIFHPELRRALEQIGRGKIFGKPLLVFAERDVGHLIDEVARAAQILSRSKVGALIVVEGETGLTDYVETGIRIDGEVSAEFLINLFVPNTPLHDGAVIIQGDRIAAAGCYLPLTDNPNLSKELGTRHRAGLGISEQSDALAVIVSEETGAISVARDGQLVRYLDAKGLREIMKKRLAPDQTTNLPFWRRRGEDSG